MGIGPGVVVGVVVAVALIGMVIVVVGFIRVVVIVGIVVMVGVIIVVVGMVVIVVSVIAVVAVGLIRVVVVVVAVGLIGMIVSVVVVAVGLIRVVVVAFAGPEVDGLDVVGDVKDRRARRSHRIEGVDEALLQAQSVGHYQSRLLHLGPVGQRRRVPVGVHSGLHDRLHHGQTVAGQVGGHVGPDAGGAQHQRRFPFGLDGHFAAARRGLLPRLRVGCFAFGLNGHFFGFDGHFAAAVSGFVAASATRRQQGQPDERSGDPISKNSSHYLFLSRPRGHRNLTRAT